MMYGHLCSWSNKRVWEDIQMKKHVLWSVLFLILILTTTLSFGATYCPDGQWHADGICKICPDGSWTTAPRCTIAPSGRWVPDYGRGTSLTPNGDYIPNTGRMVMCPDGNYYPGTSCRLLPDGRWIGVQY